MKIRSVIENLKQLVRALQTPNPFISVSSDAIEKDAIERTKNRTLQLGLSSPSIQLRILVGDAQLERDLEPGVISGRIYREFHDQDSLNIRKILDMTDALEKQDLPREAQHLFVLCIKHELIDNDIVNIHDIEADNPQINRIFNKQHKTEHLMKHLAKKLDPESLMLLEDINDIGLHKL